MEIGLAEELASYLEGPARILRVPYQVGICAICNNGSCVLVDARVWYYKLVVGYREGEVIVEFDGEITVVTVSPISNVHLGLLCQNI